MLKISASRAGLVIAVLMGGWHLLWSVLVLLGWAQPFIDFLFWLHFIWPVYVIEPFELGRALFLVALTAGIGYGMGACFGLLWNRLQR